MAASPFQRASVPAAASRRISAQTKKALRHWFAARARVCVATISVGSAAVWLVVEPVETPSSGASTSFRQEACQVAECD
jgi:hypothetical protein